MTHFTNKPFGSAGAVRRRAPAMQAKNQDQDVEPYATKYSCSSHQVTYYVPAGTREKCPVCDLERVLTETKRALLETSNELDMARNQLVRVQAQMDLVVAMRNALEITGEDDLVWLKTQLYQYKLDKSVVLKVTHGLPSGAKKRRVSAREKLPANGFIALPRKGEPEGYACTSLGGLALADCFDEALSTAGSVHAMGMLLKALWKQLPGATT